MTISDPYATAKANLRDLIKWLATSFAAVAAVLVAGSPFSGFGSLPPGSLRFWLALIGLMGATACLSFAWRKIVYLLRPDAVFPRQLRSNFNPDKECDAGEREEIKDLHAMLKKHRDDLFPKKVNTFEELEAQKDALWTSWRVKMNVPGAQAAFELYEQKLANIEMILGYATFARLHRRVDRAIPLIAGLGMLALVSLALFSWAANPGKNDETKPASTVIQYFGSPPDMPKPMQTPATLAPVLFDLGKADITGPGLTAINVARNYLRGNPGDGLLLLAHTDTLGLAPINRNLARRRGEAVRDALIAEGGLSGAHVFLAALPETDLPLVTPQEVSRLENRTVEFLVVQLPPRAAIPSSETE